MEVAVDTDFLVDIVKRVLLYFVEILKSRLDSRKIEDLRVELSLTKEETEYYSIRIAIIGGFIPRILQFSNKVFRRLVQTEVVPKNTVLASIRVKTAEKVQEKAYNLRYVRKCLSLCKDTSNKPDIESPQEFFSMTLKFKLPSRDLERFKHSTTTEMVALEETNPGLNFTYFCDGKSIHSNCLQLNKNYKSSKVISNSIMNILKQSLTNSFRDSCFSSLNVTNSRDAEDAIFQKLIPMLNKNE